MSPIPLAHLSPNFSGVMNTSMSPTQEVQGGNKKHSGASSSEDYKVIIIYHYLILVSLKNCSLTRIIKKDIS